MKISKGLVNFLQNFRGELSGNGSAVPSVATSPQLVVKPKRNVDWFGTHVLIFRYPMIDIMEIHSFIESDLKFSLVQ